MNRLVVPILVLLVALVPASPASTGAPASSERLVQRGYDLVYNLDFPEALAAFEQAIAANRNDAEAYRGLATYTWLKILYERGVVTVDDYMGRVSNSDVKTEVAAPAEASRFRTSIDRALALGEEALRRNPNSASAHYDVGSAVGLMATYMATVEGRVLGGLTSARRAYNEQEQALQLDPRRKDAGLIVGTYRYIVASLPLPVRLMAYIVGFGGGKERGIQMIEEAAAYPGESQVDAKFALVLLYNREREFDRAMKYARDLQRRFPRNRLLWLEAGATALRAGRPAEADSELTIGIEQLKQDRRPRSFGEEALWYYKRGAARVLLGNLGGAESDLQLAAAAKGRLWVTGRTHTELGKVADLAGDRARARREYEKAASIGENSRDSEGASEARRFLRIAYKRR